MITIKTNATGDVIISGSGTLPEDIALEVSGTVIFEVGSSIEFHNIKFNLKGNENNSNKA